MMSAPVARTSAGFIAFTVAAVPTGMKAGVRISPRRMEIVPVRALPSVAAIEKWKRGAVIVEPIDARPRTAKACAAWEARADRGMHLGIDTYAILTLVAFVAGFIDAIAGGGGLLTVPAMLSAGVPPIATLATNKLQSSFSSGTATYSFSRTGMIDWRTYWPQVVMILILSALGAWTVESIKTDILNLIVPVLLVGVAAYVLFSPRMSDEDVHHRLTSKGYLPVGGAIGFYDGFFGPGTGSFFATTLVSLRGLGLIRATAHTKAFNFASNIGSLIVFLIGGHAIILLGLCMAIGSASGAYTGSHTAMRFGAKIIRPVLVTISLALTAKLLWNALG